MNNKVKLFIFAVTAFLVANSYYDGKFTKFFNVKKKYIQMAMYAFTGFSLYLFIKKNPIKSVKKPGTINSSAAIAMDAPDTIS